MPSEQGSLLLLLALVLGGPVVYLLWKRGETESAIEDVHSRIARQLRMRVVSQRPLVLTRDDEGITVSIEQQGTLDHHYRARIPVPIGDLEIWRELGGSAARPETAPPLGDPEFDRAFVVLGSESARGLVTPPVREALLAASAVLTPDTQVERHGLRVEYGMVTSLAKEPPTESAATRVAHLVAVARAFGVSSPPA